MSIISLHDISLTIAGTQLLDKVDFQIKSGDRVALVGRNGAGKSTFLKLVQGEIAPDSGHINQRSGLTSAALDQEVPITEDDSVYHFLVKSLGKVGEILSQFHELSQQGNLEQLADCQQKIDNLHAWDKVPQIETMATRLGIPFNERMNHLSGGMKRRVLLGAALLASPDLLLLDEPTNHLDMDAIEWLESYLRDFKGAVLLVTHDREFLNRVSNRIVEIDRGALHLYHCNYETYLDRREALRLSEQKENELFDKKLAEEETWIRTGIKARRTRNEGRVRALKTLREAYTARLNQLGKAQAFSLEVSRSGSLVIEAKQVNYRLGDKTIVSDFSLLLTRGDKLGIIGPNGCGKTTLVRLLLGELQPDSGSIKQGTSLNVAYFDQLRRQLIEDQTLMFNVGDGADYVTINGKQKHVASYLREFLFTPERFNQPVSVLSGGERNRLLLAKLFAKPVNLLVMDEPTNDLDIETLELLEDMLLDYPGTLILISHDRAFINQVVTSVLVYEQAGQFNEFVGGYDEYKMQKKKKPDIIAQAKVSKPNPIKNKLSFNEQRELAQLPHKIEELEKYIVELQSTMADAAFYQKEASVIAKKNQELASKEALLAELYARWEALEEVEKS